MRHDRFGIIKLLFCANGRLGPVCSKRRLEYQDSHVAVDWRGMWSQSVQIDKHATGGHYQQGRLQLLGFLKRCCGLSDVA